MLYCTNKDKLKFKMFLFHVFYTFIISLYGAHKKVICVNLYHCFSFLPLFEGESLLEACPCLLEFISAVIHDTASAPGVLSFTLRLIGLLAAAEDDFIVLKVELLTPVAFSKLLQNIPVLICSIIVPPSLSCRSP